MAFLESDITKWIGWPLAAYLDSGSHFVRGILPGVLEKREQSCFPHLSPIHVQWGYPSDTSRCYWLDCELKCWLTRGRMLQQHLSEVVHAINTRILRVHGYTPSELCMGRNAHMDVFDESIVDESDERYPNPPHVLTALCRRDSVT